MDNTTCNSCIDNNQFDFSLGYTKEGIEYTDLSVWKTREGVEPLQEYTVSIYNELIRSDVKVRVNKTTLILFSELPMSSEENACNYDGIYQFVLDDYCGQTFRRTEAILSSIHCAYDKLIVTQDWENAQTLLMYIEYIKSAANKQLTTKAQEYYTTALKFIKKLNCNCNGFM